MIQISDNTQQIQPSKIRKMFNKALEYDHVISFTLGEPDFTASPNVVEAGCRAIREGKTKYSENAGLLALRQAIAEYLHRTEGLSYDPASQIVVTPGAMGALFLALKVLLNPGDEVIVNEPCWTNYVQQIRMCGGVPVSVKTNAQRGFDLDVSAIAEAVTDKTKAIILNSPCNPTGAVASTETLLQLAELAQKRDLVILADEVYKHILFDGRTYTSFAALPGMKERTLVIDSLSKTYAMTGWRIGFVAAPLWLAKACNKLQSQYTSGPSSIAQKASVAAFSGDQSCVEEMRRAFERRRDLVVELARQIPGFKVNVPQGAFYLFPDVSYYYGKKFGDKVIENSADLAMYLLEEGHVATVGGAAFCAPECLRFSYATSDENLKEALHRIKEALAKLK